MGTFGAHSTALDVVREIDLRGKLAVVTGGTAGIGLETIRALAAAGCDIIAATRNVAAGTEAVHMLQREKLVGMIEVRELDLADFASVRTFAAGLDSTPIHLLINNAGVMGGPLTRTAQGFESNVGINHFGHFLLSKLLLRNLEQGAPARVVVLSSGAHRLAPFDFDDFNFESSSYDHQVAYRRSKAANMLFTVALNDRCAGRGITANAVTPGVVRTGLMRYLDTAELDQLLERLKDKVKTAAQGAATTVWAATAPDLEGIGGQYLEDCAIQPVAGEGETVGVASHAIDHARAARLWSLSETLTAK